MNLRNLFIGVVGGMLMVGCSKQAEQVQAPPKAPPPPIDVTAVTTRAEAGDAVAQKDLGSAYAKGQGVKQSYAEAAKWYRKAADQGNAAAQSALGELYEAGQGVPLGETNAAIWYRKAADQGYAAAQYNLAVLYVMGKGVPQNDGEAVKLYRAAAEQGDALAQYNIGMRYSEGHNIAADPAEAFKWLSLAAAQGLGDAVKERDQLKSKMNREQMAEGQKRLAAFSLKKPAAQSQ
jgi:TPR repeat protein